MNASWTLSRLVRITLRIHGLWFLAGALFIEFLPASLLRSLHLFPPEAPFHYVVFGIASAELLTGAAFFLFASFQSRIPRFVYAVALIQTVINLYHNAAAIARFGAEPQIWIIFVDTVIIAALFVVYLVAFRRKTE